MLPPKRPKQVCIECGLAVLQIFHDLALLSNGSLFTTLPSESQTSGCGQLNDGRQSGSVSISASLREVWKSLHTCCVFWQGSCLSVMLQFLYLPPPVKIRNLLGSICKWFEINVIIIIIIIIKGDFILHWQWSMPTFTYGGIKWMLKAINCVPPTIAHYMKSSSFYVYDNHFKI